MAASDALSEMYRQWDIEMMRLANGEVDSVNGTASCQSIKNSSEDLEMYYIAVWKLMHKNLSVCCCVCVLFPCANLLLTLDVIHGMF